MSKKKYPIGLEVRIQDEILEVIGYQGRNCVFKIDDKMYKISWLQMSKNISQDSELMNLRLRRMQIFDKKATFPKTDEELENWVRIIASNLSPECLTCDGELSYREAEERRVKLFRELGEVEAISKKRYDISSMY